MISNLRMKRDPQLKLVHKMMQNFTELDVKELVILHTGYTLEKEIKKGVDIFPGMLLAKHPDPEKGHMFASVRGKITDVTPRFINVEVVEAQESDPTFTSLSREEILSKFEGTFEESCVALKDLGKNICHLAKTCDVLVVNGLNQEPGVTWAEPMLAMYLDTVLAGLEIQKKISKPKKTILIVNKEARLPEIPLVEVQRIDPVYPHSLDPLIKRQVALSEKSSKVDIVSSHTLWGLGRVLETGMPLTETVITFNTPTHSGNYIVKEGTRIADLIERTKFQHKEGDTIVLGGPLRGESIALVNRGIPRSVTGVFIVPADSVPALEGASACCNCGACDRICPIHLAPSTISRYSEFNHFDKCEEWHVKHCIECGLCGYVCITRRPVLQYIRLAKQKLALQEITLDNFASDNEAENE